MSRDEIFDNRKNKYLRIGRNKGFISDLNELSSLDLSENKFNQFINSKKIIISSSLILFILLMIIIFYL